MPDAHARRRVAAKDTKEGKSSGPQAGGYAHEEIEQVSKGKRSARSTKQAIAFGRSQTKRAGVKVKPSRAASTSIQKKAAQDEVASHERRKPSAKRSKAPAKALKKEDYMAASKSALSTHAKQSASRRSASSRSAAAKKAAHTQGAENRSIAAKKAAKTHVRKVS
ncbi:hypothetical protein EC912_101782 [Luteibacter rhizovicinus]|uniref:DNA-binding protein n=1 Tax=Luteibacter rhizovicinus TaxID=242606 RepID=A0A4R3YX66_9GAMM|nr:ku family containing domain-containing protein [Luteibacter rhizovicinus]TCV97765.1 hypothetical protein EC912_101782 [Luteibacter rhizovicinus]